MPSTKIKFLSNIDNSEFLGAYHELLEKLTILNNNCFGSKMEQETEWMKKVLQYNVENIQTAFRKGTIVPAVYKAILSKRDSSGEIAEDLRLAYVLGWVVELYGSAFQMNSNVMDDRKYQNGSSSNCLSWHRISDIGNNAVNDSFILQIACHNLLKLYFDQSPDFMRLSNLCRETRQKQSSGKVLEKRISGDENNVKCYTMQRYRQMINWDTSYLSFYLPFQFAWALAGNEETPEIRKAVKGLAFEIGYYHRIEKDYAEIFQDGENSDKLAKWSWFFVKSVEILHAAGKDDQVAKLINFVRNEDNASVRAFYEILGMKEMYFKERENSRNNILEKVAKLPDLLKTSMNVQVFGETLNML